MPRRSSADASLFELEGGLRPGEVLDKDIRQLIPDESRALDILQQLTGDRVLEKDRQAGRNEFIGGEQPSLVGLCHTDVLVSLSIGPSNAALCKRFLIDGQKQADRPTPNFRLALRRAWDEASGKPRPM